MSASDGIATTPGIGERLGDDAGAEIVVGMGVGEVDGLELLARLDDLRDDPVGAGQRPLRVDENSVGLAGDDDRRDLERLLVAEDDFGRQRLSRIRVEPDLHCTYPR